MPWNQLCSCGHREVVVGLVKLDKSTTTSQCGRSPCCSIDEIGPSLSLC